MKKKRMLCKVLLDICAFACTQNPNDKKARADYEEAFRLAQKYNLPNLQTYQYHMDSLGCF